MSVLPIVAAVILRDGAVLVTRRPERGHLAGLWEFPGGKVEPGEGEEEALVREVEEEIGVRVEVGERLAAVTHDYGDRTVAIAFYRCHAPASDLPAAAADLRYVPPAGLDPSEMPPANAEVIEWLRRTSEG